MLLCIGIALLILGTIAATLSVVFRDDWDDGRTVEYRIVDEASSRG